VEEIENRCFFGTGLFGAEAFAERDDMIVGVRKKGGKGTGR
jgi:hypothetical protein